MTTGHLDAVELAEHVEGLLEPQHADAVEAHLSTCAQCRQSAAALESVAAQLAAAPAELPTPPDVVARLDRALAAERDGLGATGGAADAASEGDGAPVIQLGWFRRRAPQLLAAAATVGLLGFAGYAIATSGLGGSDSDSGAMEIASDAAGEADPPTEDRAGDDAADEDVATLQEESADDAASAEDGTAPGTAPDAPYSGEAFEAEVRELVGQAGTGAEVEAEPGCGQPLADELGMKLVGTAPTGFTDDAVLVVLEVTDSVVEGWLLPACGASVGEALGEPRLVSID